jgi:hypothetical protein
MQTFDNYTSDPVMIAARTILEGKETQLNEKSGIYPVVGKYIFFVEDQELYQLSPYKLLAEKKQLAKYFDSGSNWKSVLVAWGVDLFEIGAIEKPYGRTIHDERDDRDALAKWYVVNSPYKGITHLAMIQ